MAAAIDGDIRDRSLTNGQIAEGPFDAIVAAAQRDNKLTGFHKLESSMSLYDLTIRGGMVVTADDVRNADIGIIGETIAALEEKLPPGAQDINAEGLLVLPGGVDSHVHVDQPFSSGAEIADNFASGTASALAGGTTTIISFVMQPRGGSLRDAAAGYHQLATQSRADYSVHLTITDPTPEVMERELPALVAAGHRSIKIFMANASTRLTDPQILTVLAAARKLGALVCIHAEHHELIEWLTERLLAQGRTAPSSLALAKPMIAEREATQRIITLAEALDTPIQIFHVSGYDSAEEVARAQQRGVKVWAETCSHYLVLTAADLDRPGFDGAKYMFAPAARTATDQENLWQRIREGTITVVSSDHSPLKYDDPKGKMYAGQNAAFNKVPNGVPGLAARLPIVFSEGVVKGRIDAQTFVNLICTMPAKLFGLYPKKGTIAVGSDADIVLWDARKQRILTNALMHHGSDYTPFEGLATMGAPVSVFLRGRLAFDGSNVVAEPGNGVFLPRRPYGMIAPTGEFAVGFDPYL
jgi:dihydropyrimidinase